MPIYQKSDTSRPATEHKTYPYLLGRLRVERPNQVWCADITSVPIRKGFFYPVEVIGLVNEEGAVLAHLQHAGPASASRR